MDPHARIEEGFAYYQPCSSSRPSSFYGQLLATTSSSTSAAATASAAASALSNATEQLQPEPATPSGQSASRRALSPLVPNKLHGFKTSPTVMTSPPYLGQYQDTMHEQLTEKTPFTCQRPLSIGSVGDFSSPTHRPPSASGRNHRRTRSRIAAPIGELDTMDSMGLSYSDTMSPPTPLGSPRPLDSHLFRSVSSLGAPGASCPNIGLGIISAPPTPPSEQLASLQDIFVALAHKERTVLEAQQALDEAWEDLKQFRNKLNSTLGPVTGGPPTLVFQPQIISRHYFPNLGINALVLEAEAPVNDAEFASLIGAWDLDDTLKYDLKAQSVVAKSSFTRKFVVFLLDVLHCIITTTLPTVQTGTQAPVQLGTKRSLANWRPVYPSPTKTMLYAFKS